MMINNFEIELNLLFTLINVIINQLADSVLI